MDGATDMVRRVGDALASPPGVEAVMLGGSRAVGEAAEESDYDFSVCYRSGFDPDSLKKFGWSGAVSAIGGWGGGVMNGGAWLTIEGAAVDVHYRDLTDVEHHVRAWPPRQEVGSHARLRSRASRLTT